MIPAGLQLGETEFGRIGAELVAIHEGHKTTLEHLPKHLLVVIDNSMNQIHHEALNELKISDPMHRRHKFLMCNNSNFDLTADIKAGRETLQMEYVTCEHRGKCFVEGRLCQSLIINEHKIRLSELRVISQIRKGFSDKEICSNLNIALDTLRSHKKSIQLKLNAPRKADIAMQSIKYGIS
ncbi:response regulator transcription factor [Mucilaginibacter sp. Bleaf8]|nr:response regulator transcription factor [Mucilaginibacter sp. Bleaf8]